MRMNKPILCLPDTALIVIEFDYLINIFIFWTFALTFKAFLLQFIKDKNNNNNCYKECIMKIVRVKSLL